MGMFDYIYIDFPLPIEDYILSKYKSLIIKSIGEDGFQTKDLDCVLANYYISNDGILYMEELSDFEDEKPRPKIKEYYHGHMKVYTGVYIDDTNLEDWHGIQVRMFGSSYKNNLINIEYDLKFTDGLLVKAKMIRPTEEEINELY